MYHVLKSFLELTFVVIMKYILTCLSIFLKFKGLCHIFFLPIKSTWQNSFIYMRHITIAFRRKKEEKREKGIKGGIEKI